MFPKKNMAILISLTIILIGAILAGTYIFLFRRPNPALPKNTVTIGNATFNVELATTTVAEARGLSFRTSLGTDAGMLFIFGTPAVQNFWMKDMDFPLDMIWIGGGKVLGFVQNAVPQPGVMLWNLTIYSSPDGTNEVLEVNAGTVARENIKGGDTVQLDT